MMLYQLLAEPFLEFAFLKRAFIACVALSVGSAPIGVFVVLRRMSLMGDAISHSALPGVAVGYALSGLSLLSMSVGGFVAGLVVALSAGWVSRTTILKEDATFVGFYLIAFALGVVIVTVSGNKIDLMHILLGCVLAVDRQALLLVAWVTSFTLWTLALIFRPLILECFDPEFFRSIGGRGGLYHLIFIVLVVTNMVAALHAMGTLMALGIMMLPAIIARLWVREVWHLCLVAVGIAILSSYLGIMLSYHLGWPSGPAIILVAGLFYLTSLLVMSLKKWWFLKMFLLIGFINHPMLHALEKAPSHPLKIVSTFSILGDVVQTIGGTHITVINIVESNQDPHIFRPTLKTNKMLSCADGIFINGLGLEGWFERLIDASGYKGLIFTSSRGVRAKKDMENPQMIDPHAWHSLTHIQTYARNIAKDLTTLAPHHAATFKANAKKFILRVRKIQRLAKKEIQRIPHAQRQIVTGHDAFHYLGKDLKVRFEAPQGITTESEPSAKDVARILRFVRQYKIKTVFVESLTNNRLIEQLAQEAGVRVGGVLYTDALSEKSGPAATYETMMQHNLKLIIQAMRP